MFLTTYFLQLIVYSLVYEVETEDVNKDFYKEKNLLDFSHYSRETIVFDPIYGKIIGKMKDGFKGKLMSEFIK